MENAKLMPKKERRDEKQIPFEHCVGAHHRSRCLRAESSAAVQ
jgi:hypothetical protein